jgi:hypothetical protein
MARAVRVVAALVQVREMLLTVQQTQAVAVVAIEIKHQVVLVVPALLSSD